MRFMVRQMGEVRDVRTEDKKDKLVQAENKNAAVRPKKERTRNRSRVDTEELSGTACIREVV